ncbi:MAG: hypothetical protein ACE5NA_08435 [Nitrospiraceae bacterium]
MQWLILIPLMPYGWTIFERPEAAWKFISIDKYDFTLDEDLGKAAARSFEESGLFRRVYFTPGGQTREADLLLQGTALRTTYEGKLYSYGLSLLASAVWLIGAPGGESKNALELTLVLKTKDGREVWSHAYSGEASITQGLYYNYGTDVINFSVLTQRSMNQALQELATELPDIAKKLKVSQQGHLGSLTSPTPPTTGRSR